MNTPARRLVLAAGASLLLAACALLEQPIEATIYAPYLTPVERSGPAEVATRLPRLAVEPPRAIAPFDGSRIAVEPVAGEIQFYKGARWRDSAPAMLQDLLLQAFDEAPARVHAVAADGGGADFVLHSELRTFMAEYRGAPLPTVRIELAVRLVRRSDAQIVAARTFTVQDLSRGTRLPDVFAAFQTALNELVREVAAWTATAVDAGAR